MKDGFGREIDYLRISVTDKCNLRCKYCMPKQGVELLAHEELLRLEELARIVHIMEGLGISRIRITGGEPLVRKNLVKLVQDVHQLEGIQEISMTTNGVLLSEQLAQFIAAGLTSVNISLDTMNACTFQEITRVDAFEKVIDAIQKAVKTGIRVKVNCVPCLEWNEKDLADVARLACDYPLDVRFIELMPVGCGKEFHGIPSEVVLTGLEECFGKAVPSEEKRGNGPANYYDFEGFQGKIGFISPMSHQFCESCNRIRLTADGQLKLCLHYNSGIALKPLLRSGLSDEQIREKIVEAVRQKPKAHDFAHTEQLAASDSRKMVQIGG